MGKKEFELIAGVIRGLRGDIMDFRSPEELGTELVERLEWAFHATNPHFDVHKFRKACGGSRQWTM
jgi:hypothetical protein